MLAGGQCEPVRAALWVGPLSAHELVAARERNRVFDGIGACVYSQTTVTGTGEPTTVRTLVDLLPAITAAPVAMINETMARQFWSGEDPVGRRIRCYTNR